ncbi:cholesterol side-chain cleavage enzyme, mitochondrial-like, partial [Saccoglossus kowalevskii]
MMLREALRSVSSVEKGTRSTLRTLYPWHYSLATRSLANNVESQSTKQPNHTNNDKIKPFSEMPGRRNKFLNYLDMFRKGGVSKLTDYVIWRSNTIGPVWRENIGVLQVMITDPEAAAIVWRAEGKYPRRAPFEPWLLYRKRCGYALGVFLAEGEDWHRHRSVVQKPLLRPKSVALHNNALNEVADDLIAKMKTGRDENNVMATMDDDLFRWAMEGVGTVLFEKRIGLIGKGVNEEAERFISAVRDFFGYSERLIFFPLKYQEKFNMSAWKGMVKAARTQFEITERFMNEKLEDMKKTRSEAATTDVEEKQFVKYMYSTGKLTDKEILANLTEMFGAAVDT